MADRKLNLNIAANADALQKDLAGLITQLNQLNSTAVSFNTALVSGFSKVAIEQEKLTQAIAKTQIAQERANQSAAQTLIKEQQLEQAAIRSAAAQQKAADQQAIAQQNILKVTAQREAAELRLAKAAEQANKIQNEGAGGLLKGLQSNLFAINNLRFGIQSFGFIANGIFQSLVGSSIQLEQQLISIRGALAATNDITAGGKSIADPLERINKLAPSVNKAIAQVRKDSLELANVTSDDLIGVFQIISGEVGNIGANLNDAAKLTKAFGSSFSALGLPLAGARQEIVSILQGTIDQNSALAKTLAINNTQIQQEKAKGTLVEFLLRKTEALAASQGLVAKTFGGVSSNILEIFQRLQESFGKVVLPPVVEQLTKVYESLQAAQPQIETFISNASKGFVEIGANLKLVFDAVVPLFVEFSKTLGSIASTSLPILQAGFTLFLGTTIAIVNTLTAILTPVLQTLQSDFGKFAITIGLVTIAFNKSIPVVLTFAGRVLDTLLGALAAVVAAFTGQLGVVAGFNAFVLGSNGAAIAAKLLGGTLGALGASVAVLAGGLAIAALAFVAYSKAAEAAKATNEALENSTNATIAVNKRLERSIDSLRDKQKKGVITPQEIQTLQGLLKLYKQGTQDIDAQIKEQEDIIKSNGLGSALGVSAAQTIKKLQEQKEKIQQFLDETAIAGQKAVNQGTLREQFNTVSNNYFDEFKKGTNLAVTQAKTFIGVLQQEIELGIRSRESGLERLKALSQAEFLLKEDRVAAAKAATAIIDKENKLQIDSNAAKQAEIQRQIESGSLFEIDGIKKVSALKEEAKKLEIQGIDEKLKFAQAGSDLERELVNQRKKAIAELNKVQQESIQQQVAALRGGLDRELSANADLRKKAELATQADILALKIGGFQNETELQEQSLLQKQRNTESEIADKRRVLEFEKAALTNSNLSQKEREEAILKVGNTEAELAKLQLDATDTLIARNKLLYEQKINNLEIEKTTTDRVTKLLESQNSLLSAQVKLQSAITDAQLKGAEARLSALQEADGILKAQREKANEGLTEEEKQAKAVLDAQKQKQIEIEKERLTRERLQQLGVSAGTNELDLARQIFAQEQKVLELKARQFEQSQASAQRELEISIQQSQIKDKQLLLEGKIALTKAKASGSTDAIRDALELNALLDEQVKNNKQIGDLQRSTLAETQKAERDSFNKQQENAAFKSTIAGAEAGLVGLRASANIKAGEVDVGIPLEGDARKTLAEATTPERVKEIQEQRKKDLGDVANGAVAFKDTTDKIQANFAALPDSLKATKIALQEVTAQAKELSENPIFNSREEQAAKQRQAEAQAQLQAKQQAAQKANISQRVANESAAIAGFNAATTAKNANIAKQNQIFGVVDKAIFNNSDAGIREQADNLRKLDFNQGTEEEYLNAVKNPDSPEAKQLNRRINQTQQRLLNFKKNVGGSDEDFAQLIKRRSLSRFTGGLAPADIPVTVNERGQEAVTNLQTLETSLIPNGERTVQFDAPSWVHNASETKQIGALGAFDSGKLPNLNFGAIASALRINNNELLAEMKLQNSLLSQIGDRLSRPNQVLSPVFNNTERPDLQMYRLQQQLLRG